MTPDPSASPLLAGPQSSRWVGRLALFLGICCAFLTSRIFNIVLNDHTWGTAGQPAWAAHSSNLGFAIFLGLSLLALGSTFFTSRWATRVPTMTRQRYRAWYLWSFILGFPSGILLTRLESWLVHTCRVPYSAFSVVLLGTLATIEIGRAHV